MKPAQIRAMRSLVAIVLLTVASFPSGAAEPTADQAGARARQVAEILEVTSLADELPAAPPANPDDALRQMQARVDALADLQRVSLMLDSTLARLQREQFEVASARDQLVGRQNDSVLRWNIAAVLVGNGGTIAGTSMQFGSETEAHIGDGIIIAGAAVAAAFSIVALVRKSRGQPTYAIETNLLAQLFGRTPGAQSKLPAPLWRYLDTPLAGERGSFRSQLIDRFVTDGSSSLAYSEAVELTHALGVLGERITQGPTLAFLILILALIIGPKLAEKVRLPAMVGLVLAGMAVGPHGAAIFHSNKIALKALGDFGLLYLMFAAGLELDLKLFARMKKAALTFALLSFAIPFTLGLVSAKLIGYRWAAAVLMGSNWGSHTLVTYPMLRQMGLARNRAVATVVGATAVTDTSALLVLAGVAASVKKSGGLGTEGLEIAIGLVVLALWTLLALPHVARWFFARVGADRSYRYAFGLAAFLSGAVLAEAAGIDGIVGAFFAGLGLNRAIPERSPLMEQIQSLGAGLFIPIFLVSVGVLLDPRVMIDPKTLLVALVFTVAVLGGKALAAVLAGRAFHFTWPEVGVMSGLSGSQAAATLATTLVGARLGLFDKTTINAVLVVILVSLVVTPALVSLFGKKVTRGAEGAEALGSAVLVPVWGESTRPVLVMAGQLAAPDSGIVLAASFATEDAPETQIAAQRRLKDQAEEWLGKAGLEARAMFRVSRSLAAGLLQSLRAESASLLLAEWHFEGLDPDTEAARMMAHAPVPVLLLRGSAERFERLVVLARPADVAGRGTRDLQLAAELATRLAYGRTICFVGPSFDPIAALFTAKVQVESVDSADPIAWAKEHARDTDLCILAGIDAAREALRRDAQFADRRFMVAIAAHHDAMERRAEDGSGLVVGRSMTEEAGGRA